MPETRSSPNPMILHPCAGPSTEPFAIDAGGRNVLGRGGDCRVHLPDEHVSRHHALIERRDDAWTLTDLGSRHGTCLNGVRLNVNEPVLLQPGDVVRLEPYVFRINQECASMPEAVPMEDAPIMPTSVISIPTDAELKSLPERRLQLLMDGAASIYNAQDEQELARALLELVVGGTGFARGLILHVAGVEGPYDVVDRIEPDQRSGKTLSYSSSLVAQAAAGRIVKLTQGAQDGFGHSIGQLSIHSAVACPIMLDEVAAGVIYLDSRGLEADAYPDAAGFCHAVARLGGMALASLRRSELQQRQVRLERDLVAARRAQEFLVPPTRGRLGHLNFASVIRPGRFVAGDLLDVFMSGTGKVIVCCGDVTGHGLGAAILMPAVLSHLRASFERVDDPAAAVESLNRYLNACSADNMFVTLFVGVFDRAAGTLHYVDAGHGHWLWRRPDVASETGLTSGGPPVGIDAEVRYESATISLSEGDRVIVFSDGLPEQRDAAGDQFGQTRLIEALRETSSPAEDVDRAMDALNDHLGTQSPSDDITIASFEIAAD